MGSALPVQLPLMSASLCLELDCNTIFDASVRPGCPRCGGRESYALAAWLDRSAAGRKRAGRDAPRLLAWRAA